MEITSGGVGARLRSMCGVAQYKLAQLLNTTSTSPRQLHIHSDLIKPFERICGAAWLRKHGIDQIFRFDAKSPSSTNLNRVYLIPSCLIKLKCVLDQISSLPNIADSTVVITVIIVPKVIAVFESLLEEEGLGGIVTLKQFQWDFMFVDEGVVSLELPFLYKSVFINKDFTLLNSISYSLWTFFQIMGEPRIFFSIGKLSSYVLELYDVVCDSFKDCPKKDDSEFGAFVIMDRDQDYASSLLTPATYSGLLYEIFNIKSGELDLNTNCTKNKQGSLDYELSTFPQDDTKKPIKMALDSHSDSIYSEIRYLHFSSVFQILSSKAKDLNTEGTNISNVHLSQMKQVISTKLQQVITVKKCLSNHILACETIVSSLGDKFEDIQITERSMLFNKNRKSNISYLDENISTDPNKYQCLKLLCLLTLTQGITIDEYNSFVTKYLHAFGYKYMYVFHNLTVAGLIMPPSNNKFQLGIPNITSISEKLPRWQNNFQINANKLKQLPNESDEVTVKEPNCPSYVFNGSYIPLIAAISKILLSYENINELIAKLMLLNDVKIGGSVIEKLKSGVDELGERLSNLASSGATSDIDVACKDLKTVSNFLRSEEVKNPILPLKPRSLFVYIVGGMTQAEIAACHLIEKLTGGSVVIGSDSVVSSENLIESAV